VALVVAIALAIVALIQRSHAIDQRNAAIAGELDAQSQNQYETDPELSVLLATEAAKTNPGATTEEALRQALGRSHLVATYHSPAGEPGNALFSPHGDQLLVADGDETARLRTPGKPGVIELKAPGLVNQIAWSADGRAVVTGGSAPTVWNARTGEPIMALPGGIGAYEIALNRDASRVAAVEPNGTGHVFSVPGGRELATFDPPGSGPLLVSCFAFSANGRLAAECDQHGTHGATVYLWDGETGDLMRAVSTRGAIGFGGVDVSHDGKRVALASGGSSRRDGLVEVIRADDGGALYMRHEDSNAVQLSRDGGLAFAGGAQATVVDPQTRSEVSLVGHGDVIKALALGADDTRVVTGSVDGTARVWDTGGEQVELLAGHRDEVDSVSYSGDGELVATTSPDGDTRVWATDDPHPQVSVAHDEGAPGALVADPTGAGRLLYAGGGAATIIDSQTLKTEASIPLPPGETALGADWAPDGSLILVAAGDEASRDVLDASVADPDEAQAPVTIRPPGGLQSVAAASEGRVLTISDTGEAEAWDGHTGESLRRYDLKAPGASLGVSPDGDTAAVGAASGEVTVFDIGSGEHLQTIDGPPPEDQSAGIPPVPGVVFDQAGEQLATFGGDRKVRIWDLSNGELVRTLEGGESYFDSVAFSPDGKRVAGGDANGVYIWNAESGAQLQHLQHAPAGTFGSLIIGDFGVVPHFSADGRTLLSVGDFHVAAWDAQTGQRLFTDPFASVGDLAEDGQTVYSATTSELHLYRCNLCGDLNDLMTYARESVTRGLTDAEHERYLGEAQ
jgi:WD40 repeat protein